MNQYYSNDAGIVVSFYYKHDDLFGDMINTSADRIKRSIQDADEFDRLRLTTDDRSWYDEYVAQTTDEVYRYLQPYGKSFSQSYQRNVELYDDDGNSIGMHVLFNANLGPNFDVNSVQEIDDKIMKAIRYGTIGEWLRQVPNPLSQLFFVDKESALNSVRELLLVRVGPINPSLSPV